jgi:hypothetical protein
MKIYINYIKTKGALEPFFTKLGTKAVEKLFLGHIYEKIFSTLKRRGSIKKRAVMGQWQISSGSLEIVFGKLLVQSAKKILLVHSSPCGACCRQFS